MYPVSRPGSIFIPADIVAVPPIMYLTFCTFEESVSRTKPKAPAGAVNVCAVVVKFVISAYDPLEPAIILTGSGMSFAGVVVSSVTVTVAASLMNLTGPVDTLSDPSAS